MRFLLPMMLVIVVANPLFNHRGVTMLFMLFDQWITLEAIGYGAVSALSAGSGGSVVCLLSGSHHQ